MRVFYDTDVVLSILLWPGAVSRTHAALVERGVLPVTSERVSREALAVVARKFSALDASMIEQAIREGWDIVPASAAPPSVALRDPDDEHVLADAAAASVDVDVLLTGDRDLLDAAREIESLVVLSVTGFRDRYMQV